MSIRIRAFLSLTDLWIGVRLDRGKRRAFVCLMPGLCIAVTREPAVASRCGLCREPVGFPYVVVQSHWPLICGKCWLAGKAQRSERPALVRRVSA